MRPHALPHYVLWVISIVAIESCNTTETSIPVASSCGTQAVACYDELGNEAVGLLSFRPKSRWTRTHLTWCLKRPLSRFPVQAQIDLISLAFSKWSAVSALVFDNVPGGADIDISFVPRKHGDPFDFDGAPSPDRENNILAHTFYPGTGMAGDIHLDEEEDWALMATEEGQVDLLTVLLHEIGHALGLEHSVRFDDVVMSSGYSGPNVLLRQNDVENILRVYGSADGSVIPLPDPKPEQLGPPPNLTGPDSDGDGIPDPFETFVLVTCPQIMYQSL